MAHGMKLEGFAEIMVQKIISLSQDDDAHDANVTAKVLHNLVPSRGHPLFSGTQEQTKDHGPVE